MRPSLLLIAAASTAFAEPFSVGVKAGLPLRDFIQVVNTGTFGYFSTTYRYIVGPMAELRLPFGLGVEFDALYRHLRFTSVDTGVTVLIHSSTESGAWRRQVPVPDKGRTAIRRSRCCVGYAERR